MVSSNGNPYSGELKAEWSGREFTLRMTWRTLAELRSKFGGTANEKGTVGWLAELERVFVERDVEVLSQYLEILTGTPAEEFMDMDPPPGGLSEVERSFTDLVMMIQFGAGWRDRPTNGKADDDSPLPSETPSPRDFRPLPRAESLPETSGT